MGDQPVTGVRAVDDRTLEIRTTQPFAQLPTMLADVVFSPIPSEEVSGASGSTFADAPVGNGPTRCEARGSTTSGSRCERARGRRRACRRPGRHRVRALLGPHARVRAPPVGRTRRRRRSARSGRGCRTRGTAIGSSPDPSARSRTSGSRRCHPSIDATSVGPCRWRSIVKRSRDASQRGWPSRRRAASPPRWAARGTRARPAGSIRSRPPPVRTQRWSRRRPDHPALPRGTGSGHRRGGRERLAEQPRGGGPTHRRGTHRASTAARYTLDFDGAILVSFVATYASPLSFLSSFESSSPDNQLRYRNPAFDGLLQQARSAESPAAATAAMAAHNASSSRTSPPSRCTRTTACLAVAKRLSGLQVHPLGYLVLERVKLGDDPLGSRRRSPRDPMLAYTFRRLAWLLPLLVFGSLIVFVAVFALPGIRCSRSWRDAAAPCEPTRHRGAVPARRPAPRAVRGLARRRRSG